MYTHLELSIIDRMFNGTHCFWRSFFNKNYEHLVVTVKST